jgi:hypothetical protein
MSGGQYTAWLGAARQGRAGRGSAGLGVARHGEARVFITKWSETMGKHGLFLGGIPTEPDVRRLLAAFPGIKADDEIAHADVAKAIAVEVGSARYRSVTASWRKHLLKVNNLRLSTVPGVGFRVIDGMDRIADDIKRYGRGAKQIRKAADDVRSVEIGKLPEAQQRVAEHVLRHMESTSDHLRKASKEIAIEFKPQDQLPRARLVK